MVKQREMTAEAIAVEAVERNENGRGEPGVVTLSTGVKLRCRAVAQSLLADLAAKFERPRPPVVFLRDKGREEENPDDPDYRSQMDYYTAQLATAINNALILKGTELIYRPDDVEGPDGAGWREEAELLGVHVGASPKARYLLWVKHVAAPMADDVQMLLTEVGRQTGVSESDVSEAVHRFRR